MTALPLRGTTRTIPATPEAEVELTLNHEWTTYKLYRGDVYTTTKRRGTPKARLTSRRLTNAMECPRPCAATGWPWHRQGPRRRWPPP